MLAVCACVCLGVCLSSVCVCVLEGYINKSEKKKLIVETGIILFLCEKYLLLLNVIYFMAPRRG